MHLMEKETLIPQLSRRGRVGDSVGQGSSGCRLGAWRTAGAMGPPWGPVSMVPSSGLKKAGAHCQASVQASGFLGAGGPGAKGSRGAGGQCPR